MLHVTPDYVRDLQLKHNLVFWKICDKTKKAVINRNQTNNLSASIDELQNALNIAGDYVVVTLYNQEPKETKTGDTRALSFEVAVKLNQGYSNTSPINGAPIDLILKYQEEKHAAHLENERLKLLQANQPKKHWIAELAAENPELLNGAISSAKILGGKLLDFMSTKTNKGISAPEPINAETAEVLKKFESIDPDYFLVLKRMANLVTGEPSMYWQFKNGLGFEVPSEKLK